MDRELWDSIQGVLDVVLDLDPAQQEQKIEELCGGDQILQDEVRALLQVEQEASGLLDNIDIPDPAEFITSTVRAQPTKQLERYSELERVGAGGMGVVYKATDLRLGREVALKFISPLLVDDAQSQQRFLAEAKTISKIDHPNVCTILDVGETDDGQMYFTMPFYTGKSLREYIREGPLDVGAAIDIIIQVAQAAEAVHAHGVIHRDIKPGNVLVTTEGLVKLLDFGIAKVETSDLTQKGQLVGTMSYMSPEQIRGDEVDHRADIWSIGVLFYELLTTTLPFSGRNHLELAQAILHGTAQPIRDFVSGLPEIGDSIVAQTLAVNTDDRYQSATQLLRDLRQLRATISSSTQRHGAARFTDYRSSEPSEEQSALGISTTGATEVLTGTDPTTPPKTLNRKRLAVDVAILAAVVVVGVFWVLRAPEPSEETEPSPIAAPVRGVSDTAIRLGMTAPFSGSARELGRSMRTGIEARLEEANAAGGIHGRKIELLTLDDRNEPARARRNAKRFLDPDAGVFALIGAIGTPIANAILPEIREHETILFGQLSGAQVLRQTPPERYVYNFRPSNAQETAVLLEHLVEVEGVDPAKVAVLYQDDAYGEDGVQGVKNALRERGVQAPACIASYERSKLQIDDAVAEVAAHKDDIEAIVVVGSYRASAAFTKGMRQQGYAGKVANVSSVGSLPLAEEFRQIGPKFGEGVIIAQIVPFYDSHATLVRRYRKALAKYFPEESPNFVSLEGYISASILLEALERNGQALDTDSLVDALETMEALDIGLGPEVSFGPSDHQASDYIWGSRLTADGKFERIELPQEPARN